VARSWKGEPWDDVEVLTGKVMKPTPGRKKTILLGKCMYNLHKNDANINEMIAVKGCPPTPKTVLAAFRQAGIEMDPEIFENMDKAPGYFMKRYEGKPEFDDSFFGVS
jgi:Ni,Fe-hydrogenase III small subunit